MGKLTDYLLDGMRMDRSGENKTISMGKKTDYLLSGMRMDRRKEKVHTRWGN